MKHTSSLFRLNPFLDKEGILRVDGRLTRASVPFHVKHPVILPRKGHVTALVIKHYHQRIRHQGRGMTGGSSDNRWKLRGRSSYLRLPTVQETTCFPPRSEDGRLTQRPL
jgi:hypothetical protein